MERSREYRQAFAIFALMAVVFFYPLLCGRIVSEIDVIYFFSPWSAVKPDDLSAPSNSMLSDQTVQFLPFFHVARESLRQNQFPLWNPYIMGGTPLLANGISALLFPLNWPFYFLPFYLGFTVSALLKMLIASLTTYAFARRISLSHPAAIMAGTAYSFSAFSVFWLNHPQTNVTIFFPLLLLLAERIKESPSLSSMALLGLTVGVQLLGGHVEIAFHIASATTLFFLFRVMEYRKDRSAMVARLKMFIGGYVLGFFLAAVLLIPFLEFLSQSETWQVRSGSNPFYLKPIILVTLYLSDFFIYRGWPSNISLYHALSLYTGICPLILAIVLLTCRPQKISVFFAGLSLFGFLIVFRVPPFFYLLTSLPIFRQTPNYYMVVFYVLSVSLLGGMGLDLVLTIEQDYALRGRVKNFLITGSFILLLLAAILILITLKTPFLLSIMKGLDGSSSVGVLGDILSQMGTNLARSEVFAGFTLSVLAAILLAHPSKAFLGALAVGITFVDLLIAGVGWNPLIPIRWAKVPLPPAIHFLKEDKEIYRVVGIPSVMAPPNTGTLFDLQDIRGYDVLVDHRYHTFFKKALKGKAEWWTYDFPKLPDTSLDFLSLLNVKYVLSLEPLPPPLVLVYDREIKIYKNPDTFPRAFLVHRVEIARDGPMALERVMALGSKLREVGVLEGSLPDSFAAFSIPKKDEKAGNGVQVVNYRAGRVEIQLETSSPGLLILGDTYYPGWKAYMDGGKTPLLRADYLLKAVPVEKGSHRVVFLYEPVSFLVGLGLTIISGVMLLWCLTVKKKGWKQPRSPSS